MEREITPEPGEGPVESIMVFAVGQGMKQILFRIQLTQPLYKLKEHYSEMSGIPRENLSFRCGDRPIIDDETALELGLKDNGIIDVQDLRGSAICAPQMLGLKDNGFIDVQDLRGAAFFDPIKLGLQDNGFIDVQDFRGAAICAPQMELEPEPDIQIIKEFQSNVVNKAVEEPDSDIEVEYENVWIHVTVVVEGLRDRLCKAQVNEPLNALKRNYRDIKKLDLSSLTFVYKGRIVGDDDTPRMLKMMDHDVVWTCLV
ncbi:uncharacterized protein LOC124171194 [Ischnura elegans]|uniref:uncharacterized protein LOC124171194 n=1 Tax=Ischnura elegans TaxID=197161 RepID=UPI001ED86F59|nr:uncharacterized protein LOC124171194 [Ischnura elegans]